MTAKQKRKPQARPITMDDIAKRFLNTAPAPKQQGAQKPAQPAQPSK